MCLQDDHHVQLCRCQHGSFHLRVANTTLHLSAEQVIALRAELNRCIRSDEPDADDASYPDRKDFGHDRFGPFMN